MSLDDDKAMVRHRPVTPDESTTHPSVPESVQTPIIPSSQPANFSWQKGDRVLAPWDLYFLYPGVIRQIYVDPTHGDQACIDFDDGDAGWVYVASLFSIEFMLGEQVQTSRHAAKYYVASIIVKIDGTKACVRYDDGKEEWTTVASLRIPYVAPGTGATATQLAPFSSPDSVSSSGSGFPGG